MTSITQGDELAAVSEKLEDKQSGSPRGLLPQLVRWLELVVDRANPILVKETRQALKSRQFVLTFLVVLIACWIASFAVVSLIGPDIFYGAEGPRMLLVYGMILAFPLIVIVPYSAFRSLAVEQEGNTYELLSISTLTTGQIITGKLGSAVVQMLVYLSAVSPCIAFTFLLRGVDALTIAITLGYFMLTSLGLSMLALLAGTLARVRYVQALLSVLLVLCLGSIFLGSYELLREFISLSYLLLRDRDFWIANLALLTFYLTTFALVHAAAAAQIAFSSENRSTRLRWLMLLQHACFLGWMSYVFQVKGHPFVGDLVCITAIVSGCYWFAMGTLLTSEWPYLSRRVQRSLPQSELGRTFLTWLNPGPGTGYFFCVANFTMVVVLGLFLLMLLRLGTFRMPQIQVVYFLLLGWCYGVLFLGLGRLLISLARSFTYVSLTAGFLLHVILVLLGCGVPQILAYLSSTLRFTGEYSLLHLSNPIWTLLVVLDRGLGGLDLITTMTGVGSAALIVLLLNIRILGVEVQQLRRMPPERVAEEEVQLHPPTKPGPASPWDEA